jgi:hypothetical protein
MILSIRRCLMVTLVVSTRLPLLVYVAYLRRLRAQRASSISV